MLISVELLIGREDGTLNLDLQSLIICVSLKRDIEEHPSLFMNDVSISESKVLSILRFHFDSRLTWSYVYMHALNVLVDITQGNHELLQLKNGTINTRFYV